MIKISKGNGQLNNLIGLLRFQTFNGDVELIIRKIKTHNINDFGKCSICGFNLYKIRNLVNDDSKINIDAVNLTCNEMVIKKLLE